MIEKLLRKITGGEDSIPIDLGRDFNQVTDLMLKEFCQSSMEQIRCHEMARFVNAGMLEKGYDSEVVDGLYGGRIHHSWVEIKGETGKSFDRYILHLIFSNHAIILGLPPSRGVWSYIENKESFKRRKIEYEVYDGLDEVIEKAYGHRSTS